MIPCFVLVLDVLLIFDRLTLYYLVISSICSFQGTSAGLSGPFLHPNAYLGLLSWLP